MTKEEYIQKRKQIDDDYEKAKRQHAIDFATSSNKYPLGSIFEDHLGKIKVEHILVSSCYSQTDIPYCIYKGLELKKDGTPKKRSVYRNGYAINDTNI